MIIIPKKRDLDFLVCNIYTCALDVVLFGKMIMFVHKMIVYVYVAFVSLL